MPQFKKYAAYYDDLYCNKDYRAECDFLEKIFKKYGQKKLHSILDLGCGTGGHGLILAKRGYQMTGIDLSKEMIAIAKRKNEREKTGISFSVGDIRSLNLRKTFDAAISMFAAISYLTTNQELYSAFRTVSRHLEKNGIFVFDFWFGPAVMSEKPQPRFRVIRSGDKKIIRLSTPTLHSAKHTVDVKFEVIELCRQTVEAESEEIHTTRFFFPKEIISGLKKTGFRMLKICAFGNLNKLPGRNDWYAAVIAKKI